MGSTLQTQGRAADPTIIDGIGFSQPPNAFIADRLPIVVPARGAAYRGNINSFPLAMFGGDANLVTGSAIKRASGSEYRSAYNGHRKVSTSYECAERALRTVIDQQDIDRSGGDANRVRAQLILPEYLTIKLEKEYAVAAAVFATATYPNAAVGALDGGAQVAWTSAGSDPTKDGLAMREKIRTATGVYPSFAVISHDVALHLAQHPQTLGVRVYGDLSDGPTSQAVQSMSVSFDDVCTIWAKRWQLAGGVFVTDALYNSAMPGQAASLSEISAGKVAFHCNQGIFGAFQLGNDIELGAGPVSLVMPMESEFRHDEYVCDNPIGEAHVLRHSYGLAVPSNMTSCAYILTGTVG